MKPPTDTRPIDERLERMRQDLKKDWRKHPELDWVQQSGRNLGGINLTAARVVDGSSFVEPKAQMHMIVTGLCAKGATLEVTLGQKKFTVTGDLEIKRPVFLKPGDPIHAIVLACGGEFISVRFSIHGYEIPVGGVNDAKTVVRELLEA